MAEEAFVGQGGDAVERQLIDTFVDGLTNNDPLKMKILRDRPDTLQAAIAIATSEQNLRARVNLSTTYHTSHKPEARGIPMEVDHFRPLKCFKCKKLGHTANRCKVVNMVDSSTDNSRQTNPRKIRCFRCGQEGHIVRFCRQDRRTDRPNVAHGQRIPNQEN